MCAFLHNVAQLLKEGVGASRERLVDGVLSPIDAGDRHPSQVHGTILLVRTPRGVLVTGRVQVEVVQTCRRCLEPIDGAVDIALEEEFVASVDVETGEPLPLQEDDDADLVIDEHHILDLSEVLRQYITIENTSSGLCAPDCKGLCPNCGANLNLEPCGCDLTRNDPRLEVLARLLRPQADKAS